MCEDKSTNMGMAFVGTGNVIQAIWLNVERLGARILIKNSILLLIRAAEEWPRKFYSAENIERFGNL